MGIRASKSDRRTLRGLSLAELMISIVVLASLSVLLVGVIPATIIGLRQASERATANLLVQAALERTKKQEFSQLENIAFQQSLNGRDYEVRSIVNNAVASDGSALDPNLVKSVEIVVTWRSKGGRKIERFETIIARSQY